MSPFWNQVMKNKKETVSELTAKAQELKVDLWLSDVVFILHWWGGVALTIIPWGIWWIVQPTTSRYRMLFVGFSIIIISSFLDFIGSQYDLWRYYYEVFPWVPAYAHTNLMFPHGLRDLYFRY
ncbi:hypothetical protein [Aquibacillus sediminis]|uniref:hypothetical protein n=1 Tax=Aquibacillus sediminis TaxID=2574734 RepID=UPI001108D1B6|nr:hypothetical protein [Aquibacillus sediminis]